MTVVYFDSSALVKLLVDEPGRDEARHAWDGCDVPVSSWLALPEVRAALASSHRNRDLDDDELTAAEAEWVGFWDAVAPIDLSESIASHAGDLAGLHALKGADAVHLASVLAVAEADLVVAVWDRRLHAACVEAGMAVLPASLP